MILQELGTAAAKRRSPDDPTGNELAKRIKGMEVSGA